MHKMTYRNHDDSSSHTQVNEPSAFEPLKFNCIYKKSFPRDLGPYCLQYMLPKNISRGEEQKTTVLNGWLGLTHFSLVYYFTYHFKFKLGQIYYNHSVMFTSKEKNNLTVHSVIPDQMPYFAASDLAQYTHLGVYQLKMVNLP